MKADNVRKQVDKARLAWLQAIEETTAAWTMAIDLIESQQGATVKDVDGKPSVVFPVVGTGKLGG